MPSKLKQKAKGFSSKAQLRACYAKKANGEKGWDCKKMYKATKEFKSLPDYVVHEGPRGGKYTIENGVKKYVKNKES